MDPSINYRRVQSHSADLHRRAELARLAARAQNGRGESRQPGERPVPTLHLLSATRAAFGRLRHQIAPTSGRPA
jgi:hypothetical protein